MKEGVREKKRDRIKRERKRSRLRKNERVTMRADKRGEKCR